MSDFAFATYLEQMAKRSFNKEKIVYKDKWKNAEELLEAIGEKYSDVQETLIKNIFGDNYSFLFSFCNNNFLHKIITTGTTNMRASLKNKGIELAQLGETIRRGGELNEQIIESGFYSIHIQDARDRKKTIAKISEILANYLYEPLIQSCLGTIKIEIANKIKKEFRQNISDAFFSHGFRYALKKGKNEKRGQLEKSLIYLSEIPSNTGNEIKVLRKGNIQSIWFDQEDLLSILKKAMENLPKTIGEGASKIDTSIKLTTADNAFLINFRNKEKEKNRENIVFIDIVAESFYEVVYNNLPNDQKNDFLKYWKDKGKEAFKNLGEDKLNKILQANTAAAVSGELGETMVTLFLSGLPKKEGELVQIFGQSTSKLGKQAAVDIGLQLSKQQIGFQVKNYTSIQDNMSLYDQSIDLMIQDIQRYLNEEDLDKFKQNVGAALSNENSTKETANSNLCILQKNLHNFLRYDEASGKSDEVKEYQNNFYILNFKIIPASVLFLLLARLIKNEERKAEIDEKKVFFISSDKQKAERDNVLSSDNDFNTTYTNVVGNIRKIKPKIWSYKKNTLELPQKNFYINFTGIKIKFKNEVQATFF